VVRFPVYETSGYLLCAIDVDDEHTWLLGEAAIKERFDIADS
jgi:hypothetical protein